MSDHLPAIDAPGGAYRERAIEPARTALLSIDMQNSEYSPDMLREACQLDSRLAGHRAFLERLDQVVLPNQQRPQEAARSAGVEVMLTVIEGLARDGRDRSLDHKI